jgi:transcriptional regulator with XRE-family HTH domain
MTDLYEHIGQRIRSLRQSYPKQPLSQEALASHLGVAANTLSRWETATYKPTPEDLDKIARFFGVSITTFFPDLEQHDGRVALLASATGDLGKDDFDEVIRYAEFRKARRAIGSAKGARAKR